jgi:RNA polymerase-interacting CarD/CdnL/TRCF family regulator
MNFVVGETVVYPHHGAATIQDIFKRTVAGEEKTYLQLKVSQSDLIIKVPAENLDLVGVRDVVDAKGLEKVFAVLREPYIEEPTNWSRLATLFASPRWFVTLVVAIPTRVSAPARSACCTRLVRFS